MSSSVKQWTAQLQQQDRTQWLSILDANSGLPGPRANRSLAIALAAVADPDLIDALLASDDEYQMMCGALCLGTLVAIIEVHARLRSLAVDGRWRVREGVVIGMQEAGDTDFAAVQSVALDWAGDADPLIGGCQMFCVSPLLISERKINEHGDRGSFQEQRRGAVA